MKNIFETHSLLEANDVPAKPDDIVLLGFKNSASKSNTAKYSRLIVKEGVTYRPLEKGPRPVIQVSDNAVASVVVVAPGASITGLELTGGVAGVYTNEHPITVTDCYIHHVKHGVSGFGSTRGVKVVKCIFDTVQMGIAAQSGSQAPEHFDYEIIENLFTNVLKTFQGDCYAIGGQNVNNFKVRRNTIINTAQNAMEFWQHPDAHMINNLIDDENVIFNAGMKGIVFGAGAHPNFRGNVIIFNKIFNAKEQAIKLNGAGDKDNLCTDNENYNCGEGVVDTSRNAWVVA